MDAETVAVMITIVVSVLGSSLMTISLLLRQMNNLEVRLTGRIDRFEERVADQFKDVARQFKDADEKVTGQFKDVAGQFKDADEKVTGRIDRLDDKVIDRIDRLDGKVTDIGERLARVEGHLMVPEEFTLRRHPSQATERRAPDDPSADHREAG